MSIDFRLKPEELTNVCDPEEFTFETTAELKPLEGIIGQPRATNALNYGLTMKGKGYNIYVAGMDGTGRASFTNSITSEAAKMEPVPSDWVYVYNFKKKESPKALKLKPGSGKLFKEEVEGTIEKLSQLIPETFKGVEYESRRSDLIRIANQKKAKLLKELNEKSSKYGFMYSPTEKGLVSVPLMDDRPMNEEEFQDLSIEDREEMMGKYEEFRIKTLDDFNKLREIDEELAQGIKNLATKLVWDLVHFDINKIMERYHENQKVVEYLEELEEDILENIDKFKKGPAKNRNLFNLPSGGDDNFFLRYKVNLFVDNSSLKHAPIINESNPIYNNIVGSIEYRSEMGVLTTDFTRLKPGSLHLANGGYLIFQIKEILSNPISWEMLKRALKTEEINIENQNKLMGLAITSSLKPEPIPLDVKVLIIGDEYIYDMLCVYDDEFKELFRIKADFDMEMKRDKTNVQLIAEFIGTYCEENKLTHFSRLAVGKVIEYASRLAQHQDKISAEFNKIVELLYEANFWTEEDNSDVVRDRHIERAIDERIYRSNKYEEKLNEMFEDGTLLMDLEGTKIGQINGLAVLGTGGYMFGKPSRITATVYSGEEGIINIERESKQSGNIHDKGVLILSGYLGQKYAITKPLGISASIVFEQSYSRIDGDSASSTELYAILSSMAKVPIKQYIAVTGSVNQRGEIQPIGGVNEKIEGFYEVCKRKGLTGLQGVMIPKRNIKNLMLKNEVIEAVNKGKFQIYGIEHIEEGMEILTGLKADELDALIIENLEIMQVAPST